MLERLRDWGIEKVFAYAGDGINGLLAAWGRAENRPKFVQARHEEMCAFEAVGYAKFSDRIGVCAATSGPAQSICSTVFTTPSSTGYRCSPSSARPTAAQWAAPISKKST
ncbi:thiamine pyrophosphate enzyme, N-terminal TPP binding domain protein [Mycobacterium xenopi 3993]|nr:thiamine pyrophosphate enzyme, N-terminal TPP binding domain protein [Mycobacterium xenopi 3993]